MEYEIRDGEIVYGDEGPVGVMVTERHVGQTTEPDGYVAWAGERTHPGLEDALSTWFGSPV